MALAPGVTPNRSALLVRLSVILFFAELAHGMLLYGIIPELTGNKFLTGTVLFGFMPVTAVQLAGFCLAGYTFAELFLKVPAGHVVDHYGPDRPLQIGLIVSFASVPMILLSRNPHFILLGSILHGVGASPIWPAVISAWTRGRSAHERGAIMGQILTGWMAGLGVGVILGNVVAGFTGRAEIAATFAPLALWMVPVVSALWGAQRLGVPWHHGLEESEMLAVPTLRFPPELKVMAIGLLLQNLAFGSLILAFNYLAVDYLQLNRAQFGLMILLGGGPAVFLLGPMGKISDRIGRRNSVIRAMLVVAPLIAATPFLHYVPVHPWVRLAIMVPGLLVAGVAYALMLPAWHALALGRIPERQRGRFLALLMSVEMLALAGGHLIGPSIYARVNFWAPFVMAGIVFGGLGILYALGYILPQEVHDDPNAGTGERGNGGMGDSPEPFSQNGSGEGGRELTTESTEKARSDGVVE